MLIILITIQFSPLKNNNQKIREYYSDLKAKPTKWDSEKINIHYEPEMQMHQTANYMKEWNNNIDTEMKFNKVYKEKSVVTIIKKERYNCYWS